jgi:hypothetical protein
MPSSAGQNTFFKILISSVREMTVVMPFTPALKFSQMGGTGAAGHQHRWAGILPDSAAPAAGRQRRSRPLGGDQLMNAAELSDRKGCLNAAD